MKENYVNLKIKKTPAKPRNLFVKMKEWHQINAKETFIYFYCSNFNHRVNNMSWYSSYLISSIFCWVKLCFLNASSLTLNSNTKDWYI